jgi:hypothetical protein
MAHRTERPCSIYIHWYDDQSNKYAVCHAFDLQKRSRNPKLSEKVGPTQRTLTKVSHKVTQRTKLIHDLLQTRCVLRCQVKSSCSEPGDMCVCSVLSTDFTLKSAKPVGAILDYSLRRL